MRTIKLVLAGVPLAFALGIACSGENKPGDTITSGGTGGTAGGPGAAGFTNTAGNGMAGGTPWPQDPGCQVFGEQCAGSGECCSGICDPQSGTCSSTITECAPAGEPCDAPTDCCNLVCTSGTCGSEACVSDTGDCDADGDCCSGTCSGSTCQPLNTACRTAGNACDSDGQCCSALCTDGICQLGSSFCIQTGDVCARSTDCCSAICNIESGDVGTCAPPPSGSTRCEGVEGEVCQDCGDCCSRLCAPYGPTGVMVCQPAQGCRILGDLCRQDSDCCGAPGTGLPGDGNVECQKDEGAVLGVCRNPRSCSPQGNVCHYREDENYPCQSVSSAPNNCCGDTGGQDGMCQLDAMGVPRCNGLADCVPRGEACSSSMDCCDNVPCVWNADAGQFQCYDPPGDEPCVVAGGPCTVNADCCPPSTCIRPVGSTQGTCGEPPGDVRTTTPTPRDTATLILSEHKTPAVLVSIRTPPLAAQ